MADKKEVLRLQELAYKARRNLVELCGAYNGSIHMGGDMSMMDVLTCLFQHTMHVAPELQEDPKRDRFILSKGHGAVGMYIVMALSIRKSVRLTENLAVNSDSIRARPDCRCWRLPQALWDMGWPSAQDLLLLRGKRERRTAYSA